MQVLPLDCGVPGFLRFVGLFNAAVWVGGSVFFSFLAGSVFFAPEVTDFTPPPYNGLVAQAMLGRYFTLHYICGTIASLHLLIGWLYSGGGFPKRAVAVVCVLLGLALVGGKFISPKLAVWHGVSQIVNLAMLILLIWRFWRMTHSNELNGSSTYGQRKRNLFSAK